MKPYRNPIKSLVALALFATTAIAGPVSYFGQLQASGGYLYDATKTIKVQLKGPSLYWSTNESIPYYTSQTVNWFSENMNISVIRAAMAIQYWDSDGGNAKPIEAASNYGYITTSVPAPADAKTYQMARVDSVVKAAIANDIYVIVDWHSHRAQTEQAAAVAFFTQMATKYKGVPNVLFEVYNEPPSSVSASTVYTYADAVIAAIRATQNTNLIIVGSPTWSSAPNSMATLSNPLHTKYANIAYSLHFYAATHKIGGYDVGAASAISNGATVFVTEWGTVSADGSGTPDNGSTTSWESWMDSHSVSSCNWSVMSQASGTSAAGSDIFNSGLGTNLSTSSLTASGTLMYNYVKSGVTVPTGYPSGSNVSYSLLQGVGKTIALTDVKASASATFAAGDSAMPATSGTVTVTGSSITYAQPTTGRAPAVVTYNYYLVNGSKKSKQRITFNINRAPIAPDTTLSMSYTKATTTVALANMAITDPDGEQVTFTAVASKHGSVVVSSGSFVYTPPVNYIGTTNEKDDTIFYTVSDSHQTVTKTLIMQVKKNPPNLWINVAYSIPNTAVYNFTRALAKASDPDGDTVFFSWDSIMNPGYTGTLKISADKTQLIFTPAANQIGTLKITYTVSDGLFNSVKGTATLTITGTGTAIPVSNLTRDQAPMQGFKVVGSNCLFTTEQESSTRVEVFSYRGQKIKTAFEGELAPGDHQIALGLETMPKGIYIVRVVQGNKYHSIQAANYR